MMKKILKPLIIISAVLAIGLAVCSANTAHANTVTFTNQGSASANTSKLNSLLSGDSEKTVKISGTIHINGQITVGSNKTINASGATIIQDSSSKSRILTNTDDAGGYNAFKNVTIIGGTWYYADNTTSYSAFRFSHGSGVTLSGVKILSNYKAHAIELIAMNNVTIKNCTIKADRQKSAGIDTTADAVQLDVAVKNVAPNLNHYDGTGCANILIQNCVVKGPRGVCANYSKSSTSKYHTNITVTGCRIIGLRSQALCLYNTVGATVTNNTIISKAGTSSGAYSVGVYIGIMGNITSDVSSSVVSVVNNTVKGGRQAVSISTNSSKKYSKAVVVSNSLYCKNGASSALSIKGSSSSVTSPNNSYSW